MNRRKNNNKYVFWGVGIVGAGIILAAVYIIILYSVGAIEIGGKGKTAEVIIPQGNTEITETPDPSPSVTPMTPEESSSADTSGKDEIPSDAQTAKTPAQSRGIIVIDPGHGKSSSAMSEQEKINNGWIYSAQKGGWGEWRHWKSNTVWQDCNGSGCSGRAPQNGGCWYPIGAGDRDTEPQINLNNALAAKRYLEDMGYEVRLTRSDNSTNPSMTQRLKYCYPSLDTTQPPDADAFVCLHSNAGGGRGSYYIALSGLYDQAGISSDYITSGNALGQSINSRIVSETQLSAAGSNGRYDGYPTLVLFCKSPITIAYMEIGFFDNASDLAILNSSSDAIGKAIAEGIDDYMTSSGKAK